MKYIKAFFPYIILMVCLIGTLFVTLDIFSGLEISSAENFLGFGLTFILGGILFISAKFFFDQLRLINLRAWRSCVFAYFLFSALLFLGIGNSLIVGQEGWLSLYKHPFVWLILATLIGHLILFIYKQNKPQIS